MKKYVLNCESVRSDRDFWNLYCEIVHPEGEEYFGRSLDAFWDAISAGGPGWPGESFIELVNVDRLIKESPAFYHELQRISSELRADASVKIFVPDIH